LLLLLQAKSTSYSAFLRQIFPNIQQIDSSVFA
jgi:protein phosphatase 1 regulatory subunit 7